MSKNTGEHLRSMLFKQLESLTDSTKEIDLKRAQIANETAQVIINSAKIEVDYVRAIDGAITLPFVENQDGCTERPYKTPAPTHKTDGPMPPAETQKALGFGSVPPPSHPWRKPLNPKSN